MFEDLYFYNPLFDTVVQRNNYNALIYQKMKRNMQDDEIDTLFVQYYTGILRWQLLTFGRLTLTDAMWYDSIFFKKLLEYDDKVLTARDDINGFQSFINFIRSNTTAGCCPLEVRIRAKHINIFFRKFYFSSLGNSLLREAILDAGDDLKEQIETDSFAIPQDMTEAMKCYIQKAKNLVLQKNPTLEKSLNVFLRHLMCLAENLQAISSYSYESGNWPSGNSSNPLEDAFEELDETFHVHYTPEEISQNKLINSISEELKKINADPLILPTRSVIEDAMERMRTGWEAPLIRKFYDFFENSYTKAVSDSQNLHYLHCRDTFENILFPEKSAENTDASDNILCRAIEHLGKMSWDSFQKLYGEPKTACQTRLERLSRAMKKSVTKRSDFLLLDTQTGGTPIDGESLYDIIFKNHVIFFSLEGTNRLLVPQSFVPNGIYTVKDAVHNPEGSIEPDLSYDDCVLFSDDCSTPTKLSCFTQSFDSKTAKILLTPLSSVSMCTE